MNSISIVGNLTHDPELRFGASGKARASFTVAVNERHGEDEEVAHFLRCTAFGTLAENVCETLRKGHRVVAVGRFNTWNSELTLEGGDVKRINNVGLTVSSIGPDLLWARARVAKVDRSTDDAPAAETKAPAAAARNPVNGNGDAPAPDDVDEPAPARASKPRAKASVPAGADDEEPF